jgi:c-di-GMP-binding flagellar brake protein YcgR
MNTYEEKRKHRRTKAFVPVKISSLAGGAVSVLGSSETGDISEGGISSRLPGFVQMAKRLVLEMDIPGITAPARAIAKVAWIEKDPSGNGYRVGLQFLDADRKDRENLRSYIFELARV